MGLRCMATIICRYIPLKICKRCSIPCPFWGSAQNAVAHWQKFLRDDRNSRSPWLEAQALGGSHKSPAEPRNFIPKAAALINFGSTIKEIY